MAKPAALVVLLAIVTIAASLAVLLGLGFGLSFLESALLGTVALLVMVLAQFALGREPAAPPADDRSEAIEELAQAIDDIRDRLDAISSRITNLDNGVSDRIRTATSAISGEVEALGGLVKQVADEVAAHETQLASEARQRSAQQVPNYLAAAISASPIPTRTPAFAAVIAPIPPTGGQQPAPKVIEHVPTPQPAPPPRTATPSFAPPAAAQRVTPPPSQAPVLSRGPERDMVTRVREALRASRLEIYLQPVVQLPTRKTTHYEALLRLRDMDGSLLLPVDFLPAAERAGLAPDLDRRVMDRAARIVRKLASRNREVGLFVNISAATLQDAKTFGELARFLEGQSDYAELLILEMSQLTWSSLGAVEHAALAGLQERGFRFSIDRVSHMRLDGRDLAKRGVRFAKVAASVFLDPKAANASAVHYADLSGLLTRHGVDLIVDKVEGEATVPELLDAEVKFAQGFLFGQPRPVRAEVILDEPAAPAKGAASPEARRA